MVICGARVRGDVLGGLHHIGRRLQRFRPDESHVGAHQCPHRQQRAAHVEAAISDVRVRQGVVGLAAGLVHGEEVGEHLGRVPFVGQAVVHRNPGVGGEVLDVGLAVATKLDRVVHAPEHARRVGHRLLVTELRARRIEVGHVSALIEGRHLERRPRARRRLLEDQGDVLARQTLALGARVLGDLERLGQLQQEPQLLRREVDLLEKAAIAQVVHLIPFRPPPCPGRPLLERLRAPSTYGRAGWCGPTPGRVVAGGSPIGTRRQRKRRVNRR